MHSTSNGAACKCCFECKRILDDQLYLLQLKRRFKANFNSLPNTYVQRKIDMEMHTPYRMAIFLKSIKLNYVTLRKM